MKKFNSLLTGLLLTASVFLTQQATAQAPQRMSYQSVLRNSSNVLLAETLVGIKISVLQGGASGTAVYVETQTATTNANGLLSIQIGAGTATTGSFATINWAAGTYFIKTETDPAGGTNYSITGTQEVLSVPYALSAGNGISTAQADAIVTMQAQIAALQAQRGFVHYIGESFEGGVIFHLWKDASNAEHGLIVSLDDLGDSPFSNTSRWSTVSSSNAFSSSTWNGLANSFAIINQIGHYESAAKLCLDLVSGGKSDWYLPAIDELNILMINRFTVNKTLYPFIGDQVRDHYWSSTERYSLEAFISTINTDNGDNTETKDSRLGVRAIRAF